ncbi:hypothetical protein GWI33_007611 [Rhynchophorus ferrugineus]|uniref:Reverse transcriptase n=1 Tax=Rhynchophorus ferrugineus TaxID=354439 RepID=A0A834IA75_RHYFE|nr:hypothetical protein GWI33_007611 [Rhynchophorus ferrugineus]
MWTNKLTDSCDAKALALSSQSKHQHDWMGDDTGFLLGMDYVNSVSLRINAFLSKAKTARDRTEYRFCQTGCGTVETQNHIMQQCHRTYDARIRRHDSVWHTMYRRFYEIRTTMSRKNKGL